MNKEFVPYEEALALKELGCVVIKPFMEYDTWGLLQQVGLLESHQLESITAPLYQQAFRWFREKYKLLHTVNIDLSDNLKDKVYIYSIEDHLGSIVDRSEEYKSYEEAELACIRKVIKIVKQNKDEKI